MKKFVFLVLAFSLLSKPCFAMKTPVMGGSATAPSTSAVNYVGFSGSPQATNDLAIRSVVSINGTFSGLYVGLLTAPDNGAGTQSYSYTLVVNGSPTTITCTISEASTSCSDTTNSVNVSQGDTFSVSVTPSGTPTSVACRFTTMFDSGPGGASMIYSSANNAAPSTGSVEATNVFGTIGWSQSTNRSYFATSGTVYGLFVSLNTAPGTAASGKQYVFTLDKNGSNTSISCTVSETATSCSDTTLGDAISVSKGDYIRISSTPSNTPNAVRPTIGLIFVPSIDGESNLAGSFGGGGISATLDNYVSPNGYWGGYSTTNTTGITRVNSPLIVAKKLYALSGTNPGAAKSFVHSLNVNSTPSTLTCTRTGAAGATTCSDNVNSVSLSVGDALNFSIIPSGTPTTSTANYQSIVLYIQPDDYSFLTTYYNRASMNYTDDLD